MDRIYMDNAATTAICPEALAAMLPCFGEHFGNASSIHSTGRDARKLLEEARKKVADCLSLQIVIRCIREAVSMRLSILIVPILTALILLPRDVRYLSVTDLEEPMILPFLYLTENIVRKHI